jgi:hypothetical protein
MGYATALGIAESGLDLETQIRWHFQSNCYPPIPSEMVVPAVAAIRLAADGESDKVVEMPSGVEHRKFGSYVPAWVVIQSLHLEAFVGGESDEDQ